MGDERCSILDDGVMSLTESDRNRSKQSLNSLRERPGLYTTAEPFPNPSCYCEKYDPKQLGKENKHSKILQTAELISMLSPACLPCHFADWCTCAATNAMQLQLWPG
ncbi:hypothetical protein LMH87_003838 [Akanthomyces muscarius]|uniref:Uncharacterized protein n=1 Tax=Akanthomyces muscarius TaxID=2231603 RepID=A0A9W8UH14_AKAMU|nr:hypothetical protein LMH87_003838 [Akanthomyces muscarius]KAJ4144973.1 hypothetical protein LMH87_003838 [Akanthomyces muscarius]